MKRNFILIFMLVCLSGSPARAWSYGEFISCNSMNPMPEVKFFVSFGKLTYDYSMSSQQLTSTSNSKYKEKGFFTLGRAIAPLRTIVWVRQATVKRLDKNATCVLPSDIEVFIGFQKPTIYISNDLDKDSCRYAIVKRHEEVHQRINKLVLEYYLPLLSEEIHKAVREIKAVKVADRSQAKAGLDALEKYYIARLDPIMKTLQQTLDTEQGKLDNLTNYTMESRLCYEYDRRQKELAAYE